MEKPESGTGSGAGNGTGTGKRTKEIKTGDVSVLRVSLTIIARSRLFIPTLYLFIVIIFFTLAFFAYGAKCFFENFIYAWALQLGIMIDMSTPPPFAAFPSQWMKHGSLLGKGTSKNIKVFILLRFTEFEKMLPFCKNSICFRLQIATKRRIDCNVSTQGRN